MSRMRDWRSAPVPANRSNNMRVLVSIGMLVILAMLILQAREPDNWQWLTGDSAPRKPVYAEYKVQEGPTDADPDEWQEVSKGFPGVQDNLPRDDFANAIIKNRLIKWVLRQKPEDLHRRIPATESLRELLNRPNDFRGKLVRFRVRVKRCLELPSPDESNPTFNNLHEMLGFQDASGMWIYWMSGPGLPKGFPVAERLDAAETVDFVGYFHAIRRYVDANEKVYFAPDIVGTAVWYPVERAPQRSISLPLAIGLLVAVPIGVLVLWKMISGPARSPIRPRRRTDDEVADWLEGGPGGEESGDRGQESEGRNERI